VTFGNPSLLLSVELYGSSLYDTHALTEVREEEEEEEEGADGQGVTMHGRKGGRTFCFDMSCKRRGEKSKLQLRFKLMFALLNYCNTFVYESINNIGYNVQLTKKSLKKMRHVTSNSNKYTHTTPH
jgi:hypothetical protein